MLLEEQETALPQGYEHPVSELACALTSIVHDSGLRRADNLPAVTFEPHAPVDLFTIHEETFVHQSDLLDGFTARHERSPQRMIDRERFASFVQRSGITAIEARLSEAVMNSEEIEEHLEKVWKMKRSVLETPVGVG